MKTRGYSRLLKLGPAIGDWTTMAQDYPDDGLLRVSSVGQAGFDGLSAEQLTYAHHMHYRLAEKIALRFSHDMNIKVELHSVEVRQEAYRSFVASRPEKGVQVDLLVPTLGSINLVFDWGLAQALVDRLSGGLGEETHEETSFSEVEAEILKAQLQQIVPDFFDMWKRKPSDRQHDMVFTCGKYQLDKKMVAREAYVYFVFRLAFASDVVRSVICGYPNVILRAFLRERSRVPDPLKRRVALSDKTLGSVCIPVTVTLGHASLTMTELGELRQGDIIPLDAELTHPVEIRLGDGIGFSGQPGSVEGRIGVQLLAPGEQALPMVISEPLEEEVYEEEKVEEEGEEVYLAEEEDEMVDEEEAYKDEEEEPVEEEEASEEETEEEVADEEIDEEEETPDDDDDDFSWDDLDKES